MASLADKKAPAGNPAGAFFIFTAFIFKSLALLLKSAALAA
jgi:hypothetical protein